MLELINELHDVLAWWHNKRTWTSWYIRWIYSITLNMKLKIIFWNITRSRQTPQFYGKLLESTSCWFNMLFTIRLFI